MQDRKTYAKGVTNVTAEAKASIGMPAVDGEYTVASEETIASFAGEIPESGSMLVTLEVNGTVIAYRDMYTIDPDEGYLQVGDYSIANDSGSVIIETMEGGDVVRLKVEPVEIEVNDVFRAAVGKVAPKSEGGSGGGVLVVTDTDGTLDKTWQEIHDAIVGGTLCFVMTDADDTITTQLVTAVFVENETYYADVGIENTGLYIEYMASSASDYPTAV